MNCSICKKEIDVQGKWTEGNNAQPINDGRCCTKCEHEIVLPERLTRFRERKKGG